MTACLRVQVVAVTLFYNMILNDLMWIMLVMVKLRQFGREGSFA
jgi:hypothetical protein